MGSYPKTDHSACAVCLRRHSGSIGFACGNGHFGADRHFFAIAEQLQNFGFGAALIRKQDRTTEDINTVFWFNVSVSFFLSLCLFFLAPWFAAFFHQPALVNLTRVSALLLFLQSTGSVHWTLYTAKRDFKTPAVIGIVSTLVPMPFTIWAACTGWSYWAPMVQGVLSGFLSLVIVWIVSPWKPRLLFSGKSFHYFFGFGSRLTLAGMVTTLYVQLRIFIIGKFYSPAELACFSRGYYTCSLPMRVVQEVMGNVTYPILATVQHDQGRLLGVYRQYIRLTALVIEWSMITMAANSRSLVAVLYGDLWLPCVFFVQLLCLGMMFDPLSNINSNLYSVLGRTDITLKKESILRVFGVCAMLAGAWFSVAGICIAGLLTSLFAFSLSLYLTSTICALTMRQQLRDFVPYLLISILVNLPSVLLAQTEWAPLAILALGGGSSLALYILILYLRRDAAGCCLWNFLKEQPVLKKLSFK